MRKDQMRSHFSVVHEEKFTLGEFQNGSAISRDFTELKLQIKINTFPFPPYHT